MGPCAPIKLKEKKGRTKKQSGGAPISDEASPIEGTGRGNSDGSDSSESESKRSSEGSKSNSDDDSSLSSDSDSPLSSDSDQDSKGSGDTDLIETDGKGTDEDTAGIYLSNFIASSVVVKNSDTAPALATKAGKVSKSLSTVDIDKAMNSDLGPVADHPYGRLFLAATKKRETLLRHLLNVCAFGKSALLLTHQGDSEFDGDQHGVGDSETQAAMTGSGVTEVFFCRRG